MALQREISPPMVGDPNKDTKIDGDTKSDDEVDSSQSTDDDIDLEEGEILDSGDEEEEEKKDLTNSSLKEALDKNFLKSIEQLVSQAKTDVSPPKAAANNSPSQNSPHRVKKRHSKYTDHDLFESTSDPENSWYSSTKKRKSSKFDSKPIDYRMELEAYRGTPPSSPDRKKEKKKRKKSKRTKSGKKRDKRPSRLKFLKEALKLRICKFFKEGKCLKGSDCLFSHTMPKISPAKKELCRYYLSGYCNKGNECLYMHSEFPCKFYHTGLECYAQDACRFSHNPLTAEMEQILKDYLQQSHRGDDDCDRKRRNSRSPSPEPKEPPPKRTCLLGSPPRHIREAEETKRWQEEMLSQQHNHPGFKIHLSPSGDNGSPLPFAKNFYKETLPSTPSPQKRRMKEVHNVPVPSDFPPPPSSTSGFLLPNKGGFVRESPDSYLYDEIEDYRKMDAMNIKQEAPDFGWEEMQGLEPNVSVRDKMLPFSDPAQQELDFTRDVKFDETTQFSEMESSIDCNLTSPPSSVPQSVIKQESEEELFNQEDIKIEDKTAEESSVTQEPVVSPITIPSHLPKKQQELFKRIQQHQRKNALSTVASDVSNSPKSFDNNDLQEKEKDEVKEKPDVEKTESLLYSSEDDDDDDDGDVVDVLKNLQKEPPPIKVESKPALGLMELLNQIQQRALEKCKTSESQQGCFIKDLIGTISSSSNENQIPGINSTSETKRRTLLPDPPQSVPPIKKEPTIAPKDPRLKNRDPRTLSSSVNSVQSLPNTSEHSVSQTNILTHEILTSGFAAKTSMAIEPSKEIPYKLHGIYTKPPNYTPYINASQSNPNLLKDPRLRKHLNLTQSKENGIESNKDLNKFTPAKDIPPIPKLLLKYDKSDTLNINIFESNPVPKPVIEDALETKLVRPKLADPRMRRRDSQNSSGSNTPPHLTIVENLSQKTKTEPLSDNEINSKDENNWLHPTLEKSWAPPPVLERQNWTISIKQEDESDSEDNNDPLRLEIDEDPPSSSTKLIINNEDSSSVASKKAKPTPASHLPRAIADPRMAKLHNPLDSRRSRTATPELSNKSTIELKKSNQSRLSPIENLGNTSKTSNDPVTAESDSSAKTIKSIPKKHHSSDKSEEKKRTVHRNRKSSMDYASPLNSCDDSSVSKNLNYNSYNLRKPRTGPLQTVTDSSTSVSLTNSLAHETTPVSDFLSDNSNLDCDNSNDVNLKDMFKTIDPTASPFC